MKITVKEKLVSYFQEMGYDFLTSCEYAQEMIDDFKLSEKNSVTYAIGKHVFTLNKRGDNKP